MRRDCVMCGRGFDSPRSRKLTCPDCDRACAVCGDPTKTRGLCGRHHMQWLRAGKPEFREFVRLLRSGELVGPGRKQCVVCGEIYHAVRGRKTCSDDCATQHRRRIQRENKRQEWERRREELLRRQRERRREKPEVYRAQDQRKWQRIASDPEKREEARRQSRAFYRRNRRRIQAERRRRERERLSQMSAEELEAYRERQREYTRRWKQREMADPERAAHRKRYQRRYRRLKQREKLAEEMLAVLAASANPPPPKPCAVCGEPITGRHPSAKTCSTRCRKVRHRESVRRSRGEKRATCVVCGREFVRTVATNTCSPECRAQRRKENRRGQRRQTRAPRDD